MRRLTHDVRIDSGSFRISSVPGHPNLYRIEGARHFRLELCVKHLDLDGIPIRQYWLPHSSLYPGRGNAAPNYAPIVAMFWEAAWKFVSVFYEGAQDSFILANLLPYIRTTGASRVFGDSRLRKEPKNELRRRLEDLDRCLNETQADELSQKLFRAQLAKVAEMPNLQPEENALYWQFAEELLLPARQALERYGPQGIIVAIQRWQTWTKQYGRRSNCPPQKLALDLLSYECRAAFHRCYTVAWYELIRSLDEEFALSPEECEFHRLLHFSHLEASSFPNGPVTHLFHGHVFALHPAFGDFMGTASGRRLLANYLRTPNVSTGQRLLHGIHIACLAYLGRRDESNSTRRGGSRHSSLLLEDALQMMEFAPRQPLV